MEPLTRPMFTVTVLERIGRIDCCKYGLPPQAVKHPLFTTILKWSYIAHTLMSHYAIDIFVDGRNICPLALPSFNCLGCPLFPLGHMNCHDNEPYMAFKFATTGAKQALAAIDLIEALKEYIVCDHICDEFVANLVQSERDIWNLF